MFEYVCMSDSILSDISEDIETPFAKYKIADNITVNYQNGLNY